MSIFKRRSRLTRKVKTSTFGKKIRDFLTDKRQRLVASVILLSIGLFIAEYFLGKSGVLMVFGLAVLTDLLLFLSLRKDLKENFSIQIFST